MANLLIEIGNTALKAAWSDGMTLGKTYRYQGEKVMDFITSLVEKDKPEVLVLSSVYAVSAPDEERLRALCPSLMILDGRYVQILGAKGIPRYLTYDRAASIIACRYLFKEKGCTIVDFGTTLTVDFIAADGVYEGGNISLGCRTRFKALNRYSRALPLVNTPVETAPLGTSVQHAMESGVVSGILFEIDGYLNFHPENVVVFTGGDAIYFAKRMKKSIFVISNLVLMGLALIADEYVNQRTD